MIMEKDLRNKIIEKARENGAKFGKKAELDFGAGAEWMYERLVKNCSIPLVRRCYAVFDYRDVIAQLYQTEEKANKGLWDFQNSHPHTEFYVGKVRID